MLHDIGLYLALEHGVVCFETGGEFDVANAIALLLQLGRNTDLELVDIGAGHEPHPEFGLGGLLRLRGSRSKRADEQQSRSEV